MNEHSAALAADFSSLFQFLPMGAYRSSRQGVMLRANPALVQLNGYENEQAMLVDVNQANSDWYVQPGRRAEFRALLERDGVVQGFISEVVRHQDGEHRWVSETAHGVYGAAGELLYYEGTVEDITDRVAAQQAQERSEAQLRLLTGQLPGMAFVVLVSDEGEARYRFVSEGVRQIYDLSPEEVLHEPGILARYRHPDDAPGFVDHIQRIHSGEKDHGLEFRIVLPDGSIRWLYRRSDTVAREPGAQIRVGILLDITARKEAELALRESEALWKLALDSAGDGVWDWNMVTGEEYVSPRIKAMYGFSDGEIANQPLDLDNRTHPDDLAQMRADRQAHFDGRAALYRNEHRIRCKDGSWKWVLSRGMVIERDEQGKPLRMVGTHTDISDLKQAEAQQRLLEAQLRESQKMEAIGTLAGGVAHDFNNLLAAILGNLALAREDVGPDHLAQESLAEISRAAIRARQLVQQILAFSRRQSQELRHQPLRPLVEETLALMRSLLPAGVQLVTQLEDTPLAVMADATQVQQVLMNLCTNAWQAMGKRPGQVTVGLDAVRVDDPAALGLEGLAPGEHARLSVSDDGPGMTLETQRRIFEPFFTTKAPGAGTGLGLSVVHGIVKAHRGAIAVRSAPGEGARFDVYLPLAAAQAPDGVPEKVAEPPPAPVATHHHIVYVDDYEALSFLAGRLLRKHGYRVSTFVSGEEALAWLQANPDPVDLLVTDQNMPGLSGVELAQAVRILRPGQRVAIVSGHVNEQLILAATAAGVSDVLGKQDSMDALAEAVRALMEKPSR
ncbi:hybrid sensor histidine kinase/response regulator [Hydrogenophaga sp. MI9]|uniref:hybrid sensor histidine kinase/response regulator n=1 Tax=Hydrogenophaga sp. MI9 TaxID=3453719 RepID=UPI003EE84674